MAGGILIACDKQEVEVLDYVVNSFSVFLHYRNVMDSFMWTFIGVYGS